MNSYDKPIPPLLYNTSADPHILCAIDPGKRLCGLSVWRVALQRNELHFYAEMIWAGTVKSPSGNPGDMAHHVLVEHSYHIRGQRMAPHFVVLEVPQKYSTQRAMHGGVESLDDVIYEIRARARTRVLASYKPRVWKGNVPKAIHHVRLANALTNTERNLAANLDHNAWDAIGIGLYATGRTRRGGVVYR
jgi:hypothetical protein